MRYCMRIVWFIVGGSFFLCWPLSSHYPKYRFLLDPFMWILWDIPTNAEWAVRYLQSKSAKHESDHEQQNSIDTTQRKGSKRHALVASFKRRSKAIEDGLSRSRGNREASLDSSDDEFVTPPSSPTLSPDPVKPEVCFTFHVASDGVPGKMAVDREAIRCFRQSRSPLWNVAYSQLFEMRKVPALRTSKMTILRSTLEGIEFSYMHADGTEATLRVDAQEQERDEIFNLVIGWSGLRWRPLRLDRKDAVG